MAALVTCAGADVLRGSLHLRTSGQWWADLTLDTAMVPTGRATIAADGGLSIKGALLPASTGLDAARATVHARVVGGAGGMGKPVKGAFTNPQLGDVLNAVMQQSGESLSSTVDGALQRIQLSAWTLAGTAQRAIERLAGAAARALGKPVNWRFLPDGTFWLGVEPWPAAKLAQGDDVLHSFPAEGRYELGVTTPSLLPGVNLDGVGNVTGVDHIIEPGSVRTEVHVGTDMKQQFQQAVRVAVGLEADPQSAPALFMLGQYRATVNAAAADGSTLDVTPEDARIPPHQGVRMRVAIPGCIVVAKVNAVVLLGWEAGDPARPYCVPSWEQGGGATSVDIEADTIWIVKSGSQPAARKTDAVDMGTWAFVPGTGGASLTFTPPGGAPQAITAPVALSGKISAGSSKVNIG